MPSTVEMTLTNFCEGKLEEEFQAIYPALLAQLKAGQKASLSVNLEFARVEGTETMIKHSYKVTPKFPAKSRSAFGQITGDLKLKVDNPPEKVHQLSIVDKEGTHNV